MKKEFSAGFIIFFQDSKEKEREYLLLLYSAGHWDFPKGKLEAQETAFEAALRELKEETNLDIRKSFPEFSENVTYFFKNKSNTLIHKTVTFFLAESQNKNVTVSYEHLDFKWLKFEDAVNQLTFLNAKEILTKAEKFLKKVQR